MQHIQRDRKILVASVARRVNNVSAVLWIWKTLKAEWPPIVALVVVALFASLGLTVFKDFFNQNEGTVIAITTSVLVGVTALYAWHTRELAWGSYQLVTETREMVSNTKEQLRQGVLPLLVFDNPLRPPSAFVAVKNIGTGPALNLRCWVEFKVPGSVIHRNEDTSPSRRAFSLQVLGVGQLVGAPGQSGVTEWKISLDQIAPIDQVTDISFKALYQDVYGGWFRSVSRIARIDGNWEPAEFSRAGVTEETVRRNLSSAGFKDV